MSSKLKDLIYAKTGIAIDSDGLVSDPGGQILIASLMALVAKSDGGVSPDEMTRMVELLRERFRLTLTSCCRMCLGTKLPAWLRQLGAM